jgi:hypothetical protein
MIFLFAGVSFPCKYMYLQLQYTFANVQNIS